MTVRVERERQASGSDVAVVTLDDPARRNILSPAMVSALVDATTELGADPGVGAVVVTGAPPAFCGGAPLASLADASALGSGPAGPAGPASGRAGTAGDPRAALLAIYAAFEAVERLPMPTIAAVNGAAVGAGLNLALACDVRVAARSARFDSRFLSLGLHPGGGHTWSLARLVGPGAAHAMVLFGEVVGGGDAERIGLAWRTVDDDELIEAAIALARQAAGAPSVLARRTKATMRATRALASREDATLVELDAQLWSLAEPELAARVVDAARARGPRRG
ncbi:MAG TPA: enoyl-CoA hydratase-related protein [Acidimicrobiales bacterium]|nr:enoyl-CoA hydratase-related protein [Acidimicrobiales bacterium]